MFGVVRAINNKNPLFFFLLLFLPSTLIVVSSRHHQVALGIDDSKTVEYQIHEEMSVPRYIGNVAMDSGFLSDKNNSDTSESLIRFHFKSSQILSSHLDLLRLEETTGDLFVVRRIDRDALCSSGVRGVRIKSQRLDECHLTFDVVIKPLRFFEIIKVTVIILDINDNNPRFRVKRTKLEIIESSPIGSLFPLPSAEDDDEGNFSIQEFRLMGQFEEYFELNIEEHADGSIDARLMLASKLDRETRDHYEVTLVAIDGGRPPRSGSIVIDIVVLDSNDNPPTFERSFYRASVPEDAPVGRSVLAVSATDRDLGANAEVTYAIDDDRNFFGIERQSGRLFLKRPLDYEQIKQHRFTVSAFNEDSIEHSPTAIASVAILVDDVNDETPHISVNLLTSSGQAEVFENSALGLFVAHATVRDADSGSGGQITCSIIDQSNFCLESLFGSEYKITTGRVFDRESQDKYEVTITCRDHGNPSLTSAKTLDVAILDDNDNDPTFLESVQILLLPEDVPRGTLVTVASALDRDVGKNGFVTYSLVHDDDDDGGLESSKFSIDALSGQITTRATLDFETNVDHKLVVCAKDAGDPPRTSTCLFHLKLVDVNDVPPLFDQPDGYSFELDENRPPDSLVGTVKATDADSSPRFQLVEFSLMNAEGRFKVNPMSGDITAASSLDREQKSIYRFIVVAENVAETSQKKNFKKLSSSANVSVFLRDANDNSPIFLYPNSSFQSIEIFRNAASNVGSLLVRCRAIDLDVGDNALLSYEIVYGNEEGKFDIDPHSGIIYVAKNLVESQIESSNGDDSNWRKSKKENKKIVFHLVLKASDNGEPPQSAVADLVIFVNDTALPAQLRTQASPGLHPSGTFLVGLVGSLVGGVVVLCCMVWAMLVFCRVSHKRGRLRNAQIGGMFRGNKYDKESVNVLNLSGSKPELGLSVKSLNTWHNNGKLADLKNTGCSMPNLRRNHNETTFTCRCSMTGLHCKLGSVDEAEKWNNETSKKEKQTSLNRCQAPAWTARKDVIGRFNQATINNLNIANNTTSSTTSYTATSSTFPSSLASGRRFYETSANKKKSMRRLRSDADDESTCSDSGRGVSEDEKYKRKDRTSAIEVVVRGESLKECPTFLPSTRQKPQVSFRLSPPPPLKWASNLDRSQFLLGNDQLLDSRGWTRTFTGVTSEI